MHKRKDELRDIYQNSTRDFEADFTPQVTPDLLEIRQRDLRRSRIVSLFFGSLVIALSLILITVVLRDFLNGRTLSRNTATVKKPYIPRRTLAENTLWIMDMPPEPADDVKPEPSAMSAQQLKKAARNIILGQQALALNEQEQALEFFQKVMDIYPDMEGLHRAVGTLYFQRKEYEQAARHLQKALAEEEIFDVVSRLGAAYLGAKEYGKAETYSKRAMELQPENPGCHKNLAALYQEMKRDNDAVYHYEKYLDMQPDDLDTLQTYALYLAGLNRWKDAAGMLTRLTTEVTDVAPLYFLLAQVQIKNSQQDKAAEALKKGSQLIDPQLALDWMRRDGFDAIRNTAEFKALTELLQKTP